MRTYGRWWWVPCLLALSAATAAEPANAGFEGAVSDGLPEGWEHPTWDQIQGRVEVVAEPVHSGTHAVRLEAAAGEGCVLQAKPIPCRPGDTVTASCWLFNERDQASLYVKFLRGGYLVNEDGSYAFTIGKEVGTWQQLQVEATAPPGVEAAVVSVYVPIAAAGGHVFDDLSATVVSAVKEPEVADIGGRKELFCSEDLIAARDGVELVLHQGRKHPANPLLRPEKPWEGWRSYVYGNVVYDAAERLYKMWYITAGPRYFTCYATSPDSLHWDRPALDLPEFAQYGAGNNIIGTMHLASVIKDENDPDPARRWKMVCYDFDALPDSQPDDKGRRPIYGYSTLTSPDGIRWSHCSPGPISPGGDVITGCWDEFRRLYLAFPKVHPLIGRFHRRSFAVQTSPDFATWTDAEFVLGADATDDASIQERLDRVRPILYAPDDPDLMRTEFYGVGILPTESVTLGFIWLFTINNKSNWSTNQDGPFELQLAASRDLHVWQRCGHRPILASGVARSRDDADWDSGMITTVSRPLIVGDEVWLYYGGHNICHGDRALYEDDGRRGKEATAGIGLATWRLDGFVSAHGGDAVGTLTTKPLRFDGERLEINAAATGGEVRVELLDEAGETVPGFGREQCDGFGGDAVRHTVTWGGRSALSGLAGKVVQVRFFLRGADLYSYAFR